MEETQEQEKKFAPAPPAPEITIRTMNSDVKSIEQGGGEVGAAQIFTPGGQSSFTKDSGDKQEEIRAGLNLPGYTGPEKSIFQSSASIGSPRQQANSITEDSGGRWKMTAVVIGVLILIVGLVLFGYYIIFPWLFPAQMPAVQ